MQYLHSRIVKAYANGFVFFFFFKIKTKQQSFKQEKEVLYIHMFEHIFWIKILKQGDKYYSFNTLWGKGARKQDA